MADRGREPRPLRAARLGRARRRPRQPLGLAPRQGDAAARLHQGAPPPLPADLRAAQPQLASCGSRRWPRSPTLRDPEAFDDAIDTVGTWSRDDRRAGTRVLLEALAERRIGRRDQAQAWVWRLAGLHARPARGVRRAALARDQAPAGAAGQLLRAAPTAATPAASSTPPATTTAAWPRRCWPPPSPTPPRARRSCAAPACARPASPPAWPASCFATSPSRAPAAAGASASPRRGEGRRPKRGGAKAGGGERGKGQGEGLSQRGRGRRASAGRADSPNGEVELDDDLRRGARRRGARPLRFFRRLLFFLLGGRHGPLLPLFFLHFAFGVGPMFLRRRPPAGSGACSPAAARRRRCRAARSRRSRRRAGAGRRRGRRP